MIILITQDYNGLSIRAAKMTADFINGNPGTLLCIAAGKTPLGMLAELVAMHRRKETDLASVYYAGLDEWIGLGPGDTGSCYKVMTEAFYGPAGIPPDRIRLFDGSDADMERQRAAMEEWIAERGGIGFALLGVGLNGHIGFNEPGTPDTKGCLIVPLDEITITVSKKYSIKTSAQLKTGITIGWSTLLDARYAVLAASGAAKADIMKAALEGPASPAVPASLFQRHAGVTALLDKDAAAKLSSHVTS